MQCRLNEIMEKLGKTTNELAKETGINKNTIEKYRNNKIRTIHFKTLNKLCKNLNCNGTDLFK